MNRIASFSVDHRLIMPGVYLSRKDGDITTYDLRTRRPNAGDYMDNLTMHSVEHLFATYVRNSVWGDNVIYFGPMGCQTGFYLLLRNVPQKKVGDLICGTLRRCISHSGEMFGASETECGNFRNLDTAAAIAECKRFLSVLEKDGIRMSYPSGEVSL